MSTRDVAVFTRYYPPAYRGGGPIRTLEAMIEFTPEPYAPWVVASDRDLGETDGLDVELNQWTRHGKASVHFTSVDSLKKYFTMLLRVRALGPKIIYVNSFFDLKFSVLPQLLARATFFGPITLMLAPRGELSSGALNIKRRRKRVFLRIYRKFGLHKHLAWHASTDDEANDILRVFGDKSRIVVKEDETLLPREAATPKLSDAPTRLVFASRIARIKGLDILLEALALMRGSNVNFSLDIYGVPEDEVFVAECKNIAERISTNIVVSWKGQLSHDQARATLADYDYFVLPTKGENFGHIIAEALSVSVPVICPPTTLWTSILRRGGGQIVESNNPTAWKETLEKMALRSSEHRAEDKQSAHVAYNEWAATRDEQSVFTKLESVFIENRNKFGRS